MSFVWLSIIFAAAIFIASEFFIPVHPDAPNRTVQKHFWATTLSIIALVLSVQFAFLSETSNKLNEVQTETADRLNAVEYDVEQLGVPASALTEVGRNHKMWRIVVETAKFEKDDDISFLLSDWVDGELDRFLQNLESGFIPVPQSELKGHVEKLFKKAKENANGNGNLPYILATNVGSTNSYFEPWYENAHKSAVDDDNVPIVRFFLYDREKKIRLRNVEEQDENTSRIVELDAFLNEVRAIHDSFHTLYSAVITTKCPFLGDPPKDYLLVNGTLLLESVVRDDVEWILDGVKATGRRQNILDATDYLRKLLGCIDRDDGSNHFVMDDADVANRFMDYLDFHQVDTESGGLAIQLVSVLLGEGI